MTHRREDQSLGRVARLVEAAQSWFALDRVLKEDITTQPVHSRTVHAFVNLLILLICRRQTVQDPRYLTINTT